MVHACGCEARSSSPFILTLSFCPVILFASCWWMYVSGCQCLDSLCPFLSFVPGSLCCLLPCRPCRLIQCFPSYQALSLFLLLVLAFGVHNAKGGPQPRQNTCREPCTSSPTSTWKACRALQRCLNSRVCIPRPHSGCFFVCRTQITLSLLPVRQPTSCRWGKRDKAVWTPWDQVHSGRRMTGKRNTWRGARGQPIQRSLEPAVAHGGPEKSTLRRAGTTPPFCSMSTRA